MRRVCHLGWLGLLGVVVTAGPNFQTCPKATPCYDMRNEVCKAGDASKHNGAGLVYCEPSVVGFCDDPAACYGLGSNCVCTGDRPCKPLGEPCEAWSGSCAPANKFLDWCPSAPAPTTVTPAPTTKSPPTPTPTSRPTLTSATPAPTPRTTSSTSTTASSPEVTLPPSTNSPTAATSEGFSSNATIGSATSKDSSKSDNNTLIIVLTITGGVVVIAIVVGVVIVKRRHRVELPVTLPRQSAPYVQEFMEPKHPSGSKRMKTAVTVTATTSSSDDANTNHRNEQQLIMGNLEMYKISPSDISIIKPLASGAYGEVL
ncbi:hypothetical protein AeNC1_010925, partial [Aphanomyces euteiches]